MKKRTIILLSVVAVIAILVIAAMSCMKNMVRSAYHELDSTPVTDLTDIADGTYEGSAETPLVQVTVKVTVSDHEITDIELVRHANGKGESAESMIPEMINANTSEVDGVSGATMSSKTIRAAVKNALAKGTK